MLQKLGSAARRLTLTAVLSGLWAVPALAADAPALAPVPDSRLIAAGDLKSVTAYFTAKGVTFDRVDASAGNPMLTAKDEVFKVSFFCGVGEQVCKGQPYNTLIMWACDEQALNRTIERANAVNKGKVFGRSYIDAEGNACVEQEVVTGLGGISYDIMDVYFAGFSDMRARLPQYYL